MIEKSYKLNINKVVLLDKTSTTSFKDHKVRRERFEEKINNYLVDCRDCRVNHRRIYRKSSDRLEQR